MLERMKFKVPSIKATVRPENLKPVTVKDHITYMLMDDAANSGYEMLTKLPDYLLRNVIAAASNHYTLVCAKVFLDVLDASLTINMIISKKRDIGLIVHHCRIIAQNAVEKNNLPVYRAYDAVKSSDLEDVDKMNASRFYSENNV